MPKTKTKNKKPEVVVVPIDEVVSPWETIERLIGIPIVITDIEFRVRVFGKEKRIEATFTAWQVYRTETGGYDTRKLGEFLTRSMVLIEQLRLYKAYVEETGKHPLCTISEVKTKNGNRYYTLISGDMG